MEHRFKEDTVDAIERATTGILSIGPRRKMIELVLDALESTTEMKRLRQQVDAYQRKPLPETP